MNAKLRPKACQVSTSHEYELLQCRDAYKLVQHGQRLKHNVTCLTMVTTGANDPSLETVSSLIPMVGTSVLRGVQYVH